MNDWLHEAMSELADEVRPADLRERALRQSRRMAVRRTAAVALGIAALVGVTGAGIATVVPRHAARVQPGASATASPSASAPPSQSPSAGASAGIGQSPTALGTFYYIDIATARQPDTPTVGVYSWTPGAATAHPTRIAQVDSRSVYSSGNISPDGHWLAYAFSDKALHLVDLTTGRDRVAYRPPAGWEIDRGCVVPTWAPDSRRLLMREFAVFGQTNVVDRDEVFDTTTGKVTPVAGGSLQACHLVWSVDGSVLAIADDDVTITDPNGGHPRKAAGLGPGSTPRRSAFNLQSASPGGDRISGLVITPDTPAGDTERQLGANTVLDTHTGRSVPLPVAGKIVDAIFLRDGSLVVRVEASGVRRVARVAADGTLLFVHDEPAALKGMTLMMATG
jgi:TolB protein